MPIARKYIQKKSLGSAQVWLTDTDPNSRYFQLSEVPDTLTAGKNAFLINGSSYLVHDTEVLVELLDSAGNAVFCHPIKKYVEGVSRLISIEVYSDTAEGMGTLTVLGCVGVDVNGSTPPDQFRNKYNVKWQRRIPITPRQGNTTPIRLFHYPSASVSEVLNPFRLLSSVAKTVTGSFGNVMDGVSLQAAPELGNPVGNTYYIISSTPIFTGEMVAGQFKATVPGYGLFTSSISTVVNNKMANLNAGPLLDGTFLSFETADFTMSFSGSPSYTSSQFVKSFAEVRVKRLTTFSGNIHKIKVYVDSVESPSDPRPVGEVSLTPPELMVTGSFRDGTPYIRTGFITDESIPANYWLAGAITSMSLYNPLG